MGGSPDPPPPPDYAAANREGILADIETLPLRRAVDLAVEMGTKGKFTLPGGKEVEYDFEGMGDIDRTRNRLKFADEFAQSALESAEKYGVRFVEQRRKELEAADPLMTQARQQMFDLVSQGSGNLLRNAVSQSIQSTRGAQAARGNAFGNAPAVEEALAIGDTMFRMRQQDMANLGAFMSGVTPTAQFGQLSAAQQGASMFNPNAIQKSNVQLDPNAGANAASFAMSSYQQQSQNWSQQMQQGSPWEAALGGVMGAASTVFGGGVGAIAGNMLGGMMGGGK